MIIWVLMVHLMSSGTLMQPMVAFKNQDDCEQAWQQSLAGHEGYSFDCVPFAADKIPDDPYTTHHPD